MSGEPVKVAPWLDATQLEESIERASLPQPRKEPWKYTSLKQVLQRLDSPFDDADTLPTLTGNGVLIGDFSTPKIAALSARVCEPDCEKFKKLPGYFQSASRATRVCHCLTQYQ